MVGVPSGVIPRRTNGSVSLAPAQTKRKSQGSCRAVMPMPAACPFTAAMVIFRQRKMASVILPPGSLNAERVAWGGEGEKMFQNTKRRRRLQMDNTHNADPVARLLRKRGSPSQPKYPPAVAEMGRWGKSRHISATATSSGAEEKALTPAQNASAVGSAVSTTTRTRSSRSKSS
jgi:hypothetical protein